MLACSHGSARIPARPLVETRSHVALQAGAADRHVGTVSGSFPVPPFVSALLRGSCGARRLRSLCFACGPVPVLAPPCRSPQQSRFWSWEPRPLAFGCLRQTGRTGEKYVPQQTHSQRFPRLRCRKKVSNATNIARFSLATKTSWKNDAGTWESRTEWHRCVAFGRLAEFVGSLAKGAHVAIEGELRSHEYQREVVLGERKTAVPQRVWEIRIESVLKLDRAVKRETNDEKNEEVPR